MKNFDTEREEREKRDRTFKIGGTEFVYRASVAPEALLDWGRMTGGEYTLKDERGVPILDANGEQISTLTEEESLAIFDRTVRAFLEPDQEEAWAKVRDPDGKHPLSLGDLSDLITWLFEEQAGRPTSPPSDSSPRPENIEPNSKGDSLPLAEAKA